MFFLNKQLLGIVFMILQLLGHEYGHILWCDEETEFMNKTGNFQKYRRV